MAQNDPPAKELGRRRVLLYISVFLFIAMLLDAFVESDIPLHAVDNSGIVVLSLIAIIVIAAKWKQTSFASLRKQNNILLGLVIGMLVFQIFGLIVEANNPSDFGDDIPVLIGLVLMALNRFL